MKYYIKSKRFWNTLHTYFSSDEVVSTSMQCDVALVDELSESEDLSQVPKIVFFTTEVLPVVRNWAYEIQQIADKFNVQTDKLYFVAGGHELATNGALIPYPHGQDRIFLFNFFFSQLVNNNDLSDINFNYTTPRPKIFECLFGGRKPHRIFVYNKLIESGLLDSSVLNLNEGSYWEKSYCNDDFHFHLMQGPGYTNDSDLPVYSSPELADWEIPSVQSYKTEHANKFYSAESLPKQKIQISSLVPKQVYNNSYYSIVAETGFENNIFLSEKTAKSVFAKRVFVLFGSCGLLQHFKDQGYKTFDSIIDEGYDLERDNLVRFTRAWEQCLKLASMDPKVVYSKLADVLDHNQRLLLDQTSKVLALKEFIAKPTAC